jgi:hypothetical protein
MIGLAAVIGFILANAALTPIIALAHGQSLREWFKS